MKENETTHYPFLQKTVDGYTGNSRKVTKILPKVAIMHRYKGRNKGISNENGSLEMVSFP